MAFSVIVGVGKAKHVPPTPFAGVVRMQLSFGIGITDREWLEEAAWFVGAKRLAVTTIRDSHEIS
jgi:hypothetical protein